MKNKPNPKLPLHKYIALGGKPQGFPNTKGTLPKKGKKK